MELITIGTKQWQRIEKLLKSDKNNWRGKSYEKRIFIAGVIYLLKQKEKTKCLDLIGKACPNIMATVIRKRESSCVGRAMGRG